MWAGAGSRKAGSKRGRGGGVSRTGPRVGRESRQPMGGESGLDHVTA